MKTLSWNTRGLGQLLAFPIISELVKTHMVDVIFLFETLVDSNKIEELRVYLCFVGAFSVNSVGHSRGLAVL